MITLRTQNIDPEIIEFIWKFIRGDITVREFEQWVYVNENDLLRQNFGDDEYLNLVMLNYKDESELNILATSLYKLLIQLPVHCLCSTFHNNIILCNIEPVLDKLNTLKPIQVINSFSGNDPRGDLWYHSTKLCCCAECNSYWLSVFEETYCDYYLSRLDKNEAQLITEYPNWPNELWPAHLSNWSIYLS